MVFVAIYLIAILLCYIRTLRRLAIASACANAIQAIGIGIILEYLVRDLDNVNFKARDMFRPANEVSMAFATAMFAFEGISVVLPVYTRMKQPKQMSNWLGVVNVSYVLLMILYVLIGFLGYLKFGANARDSITLDLPPEPIYDCVRAMFATSIFLSYPLQFYVLNDILWTYCKNKILERRNSSLMKLSSLSTISTITTSTSNNNCAPEKVSPLNSFNPKQFEQPQLSLKWEYLFRTLLVSATFVAAAAVPKLNFLMDLVGSVSATLLCLILPAAIHIAAFWDDLSGAKRALIIGVDVFSMIIGFIGGGLGLTFSIMSFLNSFDSDNISKHQNLHISNLHANTTQILN